MTGCVLCRVVAGTEPVPGGVLLREAGFALHAVAAPSPVRGWLVLTSLRHARAVYDLDEAEASALGPLMAKVMRAQLQALGAEHVYAFAIGDAVHHCHLHLVPRFADTPSQLRGAGVFSAPADAALDEATLADAARAVKAALG